MRARIYRTPNGVGLSRDADHLQNLLEDAGFRVELADPRRTDTGRQAVNVQFHLEHLQAHRLALAGVNVWAPNPEWASASMIQQATAKRNAGLIQVLAKTRHTARLFDSLGLPTIFTGWAVRSRAPMDYSRARMAFLHIRGKSTTKGTGALIEAAGILAERGRTDVRITVQSTTAAAGTLPPGVQWHHNWASDERIAELQATHLVHVCPSLAEGWGHYLHEARQQGAVVITTDAPPMNEARAVLRVPVGEFARQQNLVRLARVDPAKLADTMELILNTPREELQRIGQEARNAYLDEERDHLVRFTDALKAWGLR